MIRDRKVSAREVIEAHLRQIDAINPTVNAVCTLVVDQALAGADAADHAVASGENPGPLHGLPVGIKDLQLTAGILTTYGSRIYETFVPDQDALIVSRYKNAGAIVIGKTNTPEFGAGSQTFNEVFGRTVNPYDLTKTCGGSSGGAAVALATGMAPIATGSDLGGSLRNPAAWCNVVGMRTSIGRVPNYPAPLSYNSLSVSGPMARTVADLALQLSVVAGPDRRVPNSLPEPGAMFAAPLDRDFTGVKVAWSKDLGGLPVDPVQNQVVDLQRHVFEDLGCVVEDAEPDLTDADEIFRTWRAYSFAHQHEQHIRDHRELVKETVIWNTEQGLALSALDVARAEEKRTRLYERLVNFFDRYDYLALPVTSVPPFPVEQEYVTEINGVQLDDYLQWMSLCYWISATGLPAISVPCGFTDDGLPVGLQIVGGPKADFEVLQLAHAFEVATGFGRTRPAVAG